jgi:Integrase zinc binding domain
MYHDHEMAGHPGELETYNGIRQNYWWPRLWTFVKIMSKDAVSVNNSR